MRFALDTASDASAAVARPDSYSTMFFCDSNTLNCLTWVVSDPDRPTWSSRSATR